MLQIFKNGQGSVILRVKIKDSTSTKGAGLTGLTSSSAGLIISTIADVEASATVYTQAGSTIESITTLGTYAAPTATKCRFKEVDATNHPGIYEIQIADARYAVSNAKNLLVSISGASLNIVETDATIPLWGLNPYDAVHAGLSAIPNATAGASTGLLISGTNSGTTTFGAITCTGTFTISDGIAVTRSTTNGDAISATGNGSGNGMNLTGGNAVTSTAAGNGLLVTGGTASTSSGGVSGNGFKTVGGNSAASLNGASSGTSYNGAGTTTVSGSTGLTITGTGGADGCDIKGQGAGGALVLTPGTTGTGFTVNGGSSSGTALLIQSTSGTACSIVGVAGHGLNIQAGASNTALYLSSGQYGMYVVGTSAAINLAPSSNGVGFSIGGSGNGAGIDVQGGATSVAGIRVRGGSTSGDGINITGSVSGHGISTTGVGTSMHGINAVGSAASGSNAGGHGISATGGAGVTGGSGAAGSGIVSTGGAAVGTGTGAAGTGILVTGGGGGTGTGATAGIAVNCIGGAGASATNGAATGVVFNGGGTTTVTGASGLRIVGTGTTDGFGVFAGGASAGQSGIQVGIYALGASSGPGLYVQGGSSGQAVRFTAGGGNADGLRISGAGTGSGIGIIGGTDGINVTSGNNGSGFNIGGAGSGHGIKAVGGGTGHGILAQGGATSGDGINATGNTLGNGINAIGAGSAKVGILATGGTNAAGASFVGAGSGAGLLSTGGATGNGVSFVGGATSGDGLNVTTTSGHGFNIAATGASKHGVTITGGNSGTSDGLKLVAGTGGVGFRLDTLTSSGAITYNSFTVTNNVAFGGTFTVTSTTTLNALTVSGATQLSGNVAIQAGLNITQSSSNASALVVTGNGTGHGAIFTSGSGTTGDGLVGIAASTNGNGFRVTGTGTGNGMNCVAGASGVPISGLFIRTSTAQTGGSSTITLDASASASNNTYQNQIVEIVSGTGSGQSAIITSYVGSTKVATINGTWATNPDNTSVFNLMPMGAIAASVSGSVTVGGYSAGQDPATYILVTPANKLTTDASGRVDVGEWDGTAVNGNIPPDAIFIRSGTAQTGGSNFITLDSGASAISNTYQNQTIFIRSGTGAGQSANIIGYAGGTKIAQINGTWATFPDNTSVFTILPAGALVVGAVTVGGYVSGQDPATYILTTPANKLATDASGRIDVGKILGTASAGVAGYVGLDWSHINAPTSAVNLSNTTISTTQIVASVSGSVNSVTLGVTVTTNNDKTGYSLTQAFPANFSAFSIDSSGRIDIGKILGTASTGAAGYVGIDWAHVNAPTTSVNLSNTTVSGVTGGVIVTTNNDKTGYSLTQTFPANFSALSIDSSGRVDLGKILGTASAGVAGYMGVDWSHVNAPSTTVNLSATTISGINGINFPVYVAGGIKKNQIPPVIPFIMRLAADNSLAPGKTVTVQISKDTSGTFANATNATATEIANGWYYWTPAAADVNAGAVAVRAVASACNDTPLTVLPTP